MVFFNELFQPVRLSKWNLYFDTPSSYWTDKTCKELKGLPKSLGAFHKKLRSFSKKA